MRLTEHFQLSEFRCKCGCGTEKDFVEALTLTAQLLEGIRTHFYGAPITIISGVRCLKHNRTCGGAKKSQHLLGYAADIRVKGLTPQEVQKALSDTKLRVELGIKGLGSYASFTHVDRRVGRLATW